MMEPTDLTWCTMNYVIDCRSTLLAETETELHGWGPDLIGAPPGRTNPATPTAK